MIKIKNLLKISKKKQRQNRKLTNLIESVCNKTQRRVRKIINNLKLKNQKTKKLENNNLSRITNNKSKIKNQQKSLNKVKSLFLTKMRNLWRVIIKIIPKTQRRALSKVKSLKIIKNKRKMIKNKEETKRILKIPSNQKLKKWSKTKKNLKRIDNLIKQKKALLKRAKLINHQS